MNIKFFLLSFFIVNGCFGMQDLENPDEEAPKIGINHWKDMDPFAGHIIAYESNSSEINFGRHYKIHKNGSIKFGLVESAIKYCLPGEDNHGYELHQLIKKDSNAGVSVLCNKYIAAGLSVRLASKEEIEKIFNAVKKGKARFFGAYCSQVPDFVAQNLHIENWQCNPHYRQESEF